MKKEYSAQTRIKFKEYKNDPDAIAAIKELRDAMGLNPPYSVLVVPDLVDHQAEAPYIGSQNIGDKYVVPTLDKVRIAIYKAAEKGIPVFNFEDKNGKTPYEIAEQLAGERIFAEAYRTIVGDLGEINKIYNNPLMERSLQRLARALERNFGLEQVFLFHNGPLLNKNSEAI